MRVIRDPLVFACEGEWLTGIVTRPPLPGARGVLIVVGGPQYRVGSHRQFALLANDLAAAGYAAMRFDCRGMGDSSGDLRNFEETGSDLRAAVDAFFRAVPALREIVIWGLCDAASAALLHLHSEPRVAGMILLNPWVRSPQSEAVAYLKHYYWQRLRSAEPVRKLLGGRMDVSASVRSLLSHVRSALARRPAEPSDGPAARNVASGTPLSGRMAAGLLRFRGPVLFILSGQDLTAKEFADVSGASRLWRRLLAEPRVSRRMIDDATHTFSRREWRDQVSAWTAGWMRSW